MLLASKYEEIYAPEISDFTYITDNAVSADEIREMERHMVTALDFDFQTQSSLQFQNRFISLQETTPKLSALARYLIELPLIEYRMLQYSASLVAAAGLYLANRIM